MGIVSISDDRTVPVAEDLTTEELGLSIIRGLENMHRVDKPVKEGEEFVAGEWAVLNSDGKLERPATDPVPQTYLVFAGTDRFDAKATGQATIIMNSGIVVKTNKYDTGETYAIGDYLTVKDLGAGEAHVTKWTDEALKCGRVTEVGSNYLVFESINN